LSEQGNDEFDSLARKRKLSSVTLKAILEVCSHGPLLKKDIVKKANISRPTLDDYQRKILDVENLWIKTPSGGYVTSHAGLETLVNKHLRERIIVDSYVGKSERIYQIPKDIAHKAQLRSILASSLDVYVPAHANASNSGVIRDKLRDGMNSLLDELIRKFDDLREIPESIVVIDIRRGAFVTWIRCFRLFIIHLKGETGMPKRIRIPSAAASALTQTIGRKLSLALRNILGSKLNSEAIFGKEDYIDVPIRNIAVKFDQKWAEETAQFLLEFAIHYDILKPDPRKFLISAARDCAYSLNFDQRNHATIRKRSSNS
jgi:hypothetical protein